MRVPALFLAAALAAAPARAATPSEGLAQAGAEVAAALAALEASASGERLDALSRAVAAYEAALATLRPAVFGAEDRERELALDLQSREAGIARLLAALQALSRTPPPVQTLHPQGPLGAARAASMLAQMTPELQREAEALTAQLQEIEAARALRDAGLRDLATGLEHLSSAREALLEAAGEAPAPEDPGQALANARLARDAETLSALAARLAEIERAPFSEPAEGRVALTWPVAGTVLRSFGEADAAGVRRPGLILAAAPLSVVTAPAAARLRYAGPFLDYGYVVVLEPRADLLIVLAGLATLETRAGAVLPQGALLGLLGGRNLDAQEYLMLGQTGSGATPPETLYIELRHGQGPVDPAPWFADPNG